MTKHTTKQREPDVVERRCGLYGRVSTDRQAAIVDGGLDTQFSLMERQVAFENDRDEDAAWTVVERYRDEGQSGKDLDRPELKRMRRDIERGHINTVVVHKIDRISRSLRDFYELWEFFQEHEVQFVSLHEKFDTTTSMGRAMMKLVLLFAELEREQTAERTSATMTHRARKGLWNGGRVFGYALDPHNKGVLQVDPETSRIVREEMFEKYLELRSSTKLVRYLADQRILTPEYESRRGRKQGGKPWTKDRLLSLLRNPVYIGKITWNGEITDGQHEAIIPEDLFNSVQAALAVHRKAGGRPSVDPKHDFLLRGLLRCGKCGSPMTPHWARGRGKRFFYYRCSKEERQPGSPCKTAKYLPAEAAERFLLDELKKWSIGDEEIARVVEEVNGNKDEALAKLDAMTTDARERLRDVDRRVANLLGAVEDAGQFPAVQARLDQLEAERRSLNDDLAVLGDERAFVEQDMLCREELVKTYRDLPAMIDELEQAGEMRALRDLLYRYIDVIEWDHHEDGRSGTIKIMLFEQERFGGAIESTQTGTQGQDVACPGRGWLPKGNPLHEHSRPRKQPAHAPRRFLR